VLVWQVVLVIQAHLRLLLEQTLVMVAVVALETVVQLQHLARVVQEYRVAVVVVETQQLLQTTQQVVQVVKV
jgi:hypothetical protein